MFYQITEIISVGSNTITTYIDILLFQETFGSNIKVANKFIIHSGNFLKDSLNLQLKVSVDYLLPNIV